MFFLVDCNNFFASCERVFDPRLWHRPVAVLSNNDGCIIARSNEVKALGVPMGAPLFEWREVLRKAGAAVLSANFSLYGDLSARVMSILADAAPEISIYSIDEAFLTFPSDASNQNDLFSEAISLRAKILRWVGLPVSIGIGPTKTLAKLANHVAKKDKDGSGVFDVSDSVLRDQALAMIPVGDVWGIGFRSAAKLEKFGVRTALDLVQKPDRWIRDNFTVAGLRTVWELRGQQAGRDDQHVEHHTVMCTRSFGRKVTTLAEIEEAVASYAATAAEKLRERGFLAAHVSVFLRADRFSENRYRPYRVAALPEATADTPTILKAALGATRSAFLPNRRYDKAGVILTGIVSAHTAVQGGLFAPKNSEERSELMDALDALNAKFGGGTVKYAAEGLGQSWRMRSNTRSPSYTTNWDDLPIVKAG